MAKRGRPVKQLKDYDLRPDWKEIVFKMSAEGCSDVEIRAALVWDGSSFNHNAWDKLKEIDEDFQTTIQKAKVLCQAWWERQSRKTITHDKNLTFETGSWYANMKNRFGWRDKQEVGLDTSNVDGYFQKIADQITLADGHPEEVLS